MALTDQISAGFTSVGQEVKAVRAEKANAAHTHSGADVTSGTVPYARLPVGSAASTVAAGNDARLSDARTPTAHTHTLADVLASSRTVGHASSLTITPANARHLDLVNITATGNETITPSGTTDGQVIRLAVLASGGTRTITFAAAVRLSTGLTSRSFTVATGQVLVAAVQYSTLINAWVLTAATVSE